MSRQCLIGVLSTTLLLCACGSGNSSPVVIGGTVTPPPVEPEVDKQLSGGDTTVFTASSSAFETPAANLEGEQLDRHLLGDVAFEDSFVTAPAPVNGGLGTVFNNTACIRCHTRDGRGMAAVPGVAQESIFLRLSIGNDAITGPIPVPGFGLQFQHRAIFGVEPEGTVDVTYEDVDMAFADGATITLRKPTFFVVNSYEPLPPGVLFGARMAPPVFGRGLLEAIPEATILGWSDEFDDNNDGISGRPNRVIDPVSGETRLGRFGLKANSPSLEDQNSGAYSQDMGVTNSVFPQESAYGQTQYDELLDEVEVSDETVETVTFYVQTLAVPARRNVDDAQVVRGEQLFEEVQCAACHIPETRTGSFPAAPEIANQLIFPFTDMLLHDMGDALADDRPDFLASGSEWRTPPLWGIGLTEVVQGRTEFLHDGRARSLMEAILWHGGEAEQAREAVRTMPASERDDLIAFLQSL
jgi:CxxC motif-containing protein (DUF1111 family)